MRHLRAATAIGVLVASMVAALAPTPAFAISFLNNWRLDLDGAGGAAPVPITEILDIVGPNYIRNTFTGPGTGTFAEFGAFNSIQHDGGVPYTGFPLHELTATFQGTGTFILGGPIAFTSGALNVYSDTPPNFSVGDGPAGNIYGANDGTLIAQFSLLSGTGTIDAAGVPNGQITTILQATFLDPNVWIAPDGVTPLSAFEVVFGFSTTNASITTPTPDIRSEIIQQFAGDPDLAANDVPNRFVVSTNGQFRLATEVVPEPATLTLIGGGLLVIALRTVARKRR